MINQSQSKTKNMQTETISYQLVASGYKDYVKIMLGDTEIVYIKTTKENFAFIEQELRHKVDKDNENTNRNTPA